MGERTKVAVLGGGVGSIVAAFELTATPELRERFDVTVHQLGWRLGGKGASGRDMDNDGRILEHGLHVWFGFYDTAWKAMRAAYEELDRPPDAPLATLEQAFTPCDEIVLLDRQGDGWEAFPSRFPRNALKPGDAEPFPSFWDIAQTVSRWSREGWDDLRDDLFKLRGRAPAPKVDPEARAVAEDLTTEAERAQLAGEDVVLLAAAQNLTAAGDGAPTRRIGREPLLLKLLVGFRDWLWDAGQDAIRKHARLRLYFTMLDTAVSTIAGIVRDGVLDQGFDVINDHELCDWLAMHGAKEVTIGATPAERAPVLRSIYDVAFGYPDGDIAKADVAAGTALTDLIRLAFTYRGAVFQKMNAGMGDVVFAPFYEVLARRGVKFEFFHAVTNVGLSGDGNEVDAIDVVRQVETRDGGAYDPLVTVKDLPCWPSQPVWGRLEEGARDTGADFEMDANPLGRPVRTLRRGQDFDHVVLGISLASLPAICAELIERHEPFRRAIETGVTVRTQAFQLWLTEPTADLGWKHDPNGVTGAYVEPLDTYCDMSHVIPREGSPEVRSIAYFCGVQDERDGEDQAAATARAKADALAFLRGDVGTLWPNAVGGDPTTPLRWSLLHDPHGREGEARFDHQYWRANTLGSERYVLTPAGSVKHRLSPAGFGVGNLVLAGDWTATGVDGGCVEAAAISGVRAAHALIGDHHEIPGEDPAWLRR
jgi:uncharacterized protein with NAD-binding domain and iron-sulfur cluster